MTITTDHRDQTRSETQSTPVAALSTLDHSQDFYQKSSVEGQLPAANFYSPPIGRSRQDLILVGHDATKAQSSTADETLSLEQSTTEHQTVSFEGPFPAATSLPTPISLTQQGPLPAVMPTTPSTTSARRGPFLYSPLICLLADSLDDIEQIRIATDNRYRALTRGEADSDGEVRGLGLDERLPQVARVKTMRDSIAQLEHQATLDLQRELRASPFYPWVQRQKGVGQKQAARLLAAIGDPYWNDLHDRPRTVSELWAYCGYAVNGGRAQRRQKGVKANWNDTAKMRAFLIAESCVKSIGGNYRAVYDDAREQYTDATHPHDCVRCGPAGQPALAGTPLSAGHQHARALRRVAKTVLKDLWIEARSLHGEGND